jgi:hypothetical protein
MIRRVHEIQRTIWWIYRVWNWPAYNYILVAKKKFNDTDMQKLEKNGIHWYSKTDKVYKFYSKRNKDFLIEYFNKLQISDFSLISTIELNALRIL